METDSATSYACPCCGYRTFATPPPASYIVCPVCFWEDLPALQLLQDRVNLHRAQRTFAAIGAADPRYRDAVRPPEPHEQRPSGWQSIDDTVETLTQEIAVAFADVQRLDGITLHEADVLDSYGSDEERAAARLRDTDRHWSEVDTQAIERLSSALSFLDPKGFHYYLPAHMCWALRSYGTTSSATLTSLLFALRIGRWYKGDEPGAEPIPERFRILSTAQARTVCRFLRFFAAYGDSEGEAEWCQEALDHYWGSFCAEQPR